MERKLAPLAGLQAFVRSPFKGKFSWLGAGSASWTISLLLFMMGAFCTALQPPLLSRSISFSTP
jgi:hypothetical protein